MVRWTEGDRAAACTRGLLADEAVLRACSILVPHHGPGGISLALRGYVAVEGPEVAAFEQAVKRIVTVLERGEAEDPPAIASAPVTRYWIDVAPRLPAEFALRMGEGFRRLMMRSPSAWANGTVLYCALDHLAKHIVTDRPRCGRLLAGDHAVVLEPEIWAGLTERAAHDLPTALRTALGLTAGPTEGARRPSNGGKAKRNAHSKPSGHS